jgi:hypothetical protein
MPVVAAVLSATLAWPGVSGAQTPTQDSVSGGATTGIGFGTLGWELDVHSGPSGENPAGTVVLRTFIGTIGPLDVSCVGVSGNRASVVFPVEPNPIFSFNGGVVISVEDNDGAEADRFDWQPVAAPPSDCPAPGDVAGDARFADITVIDAPSLPTSKEQCKHGGWRTYGVFKNQGDCISFVATGGKNPRGGV